MMPQLLTVRVSRPEGRPFRIWVPVLPAVLVLSPLLLLALLGAVVACRMYGVSVPGAFGTGWRLFCALRGTQVDVREGRTALFVSFW